MKRWMAACATFAMIGFCTDATAGPPLKRGQNREHALKAADRRFRSMDTDSSGGVSQAEFAAFFEKHSTRSGKSVKPRRVKRMFGQLDTNGDGTISRNELEANAATRFDAADANKNGTIDADEVAIAPAGEASSVE